MMTPFKNLILVSLIIPHRMKIIRGFSLILQYIIIEKKYDLRFIKVGQIAIASITRIKCSTIRE